jgi:arylsulfatase A-like enzyme
MAHPATEPIGYEAAGGAALFLGDYKLVRSAPPYGDGQWKLYDLRDDPTETHDLSGSQPKLLQEMLADYAEYAKKNGVIEVPADYDVIKQARANAAKG